jgi:hypothetical protein
MRRTIILLVPVALLGLMIHPTAGAAQPEPPTARTFRSAVVVGSPYETVGGREAAGVIHVTPRTSGPDSTLILGATMMVTEAEAGGSTQEYSGFGFAVALGDVNGDGYDDVAVGAPGADNGAGRVYLIPSRAGGDLAVGSTRILRQGSGGVGGSSEPGDNFGQALAIGRTSTGAGWLAIGAPGEDIGAARDAGAVTIIPRGTDTTQDVSYYQGKGAVPGSAETDDLFGFSLSTFAGTGLAVGAPNENIGPADDAGQVTGLRALAGKLPGTGPGHSYHQGVNGVPGNSESGDGFGVALAPRGSVALTIGVPGEDVTVSANQSDAGSIIDIPTPGSSVVATSWYQGKSGLQGSAERDDLFGLALAETTSGSIAVGAPGEDVSGAPDAGIIAVLQDGTGGRLVATGNQALHQSSPNVPGTSELIDLFGWTLSAGDGMLHIGVPGETVNGQDYAGAVVTAHINSAGLVTLSEPSYQYHQDTPGFESTAELLDQFSGGLAGPGRSRDGRASWRPAPFSDLAR